MKLSKNIGLIDSLIRLLVSEILLIISYLWLGGTLQIILFIVALLLMITAITKYCFLYSLIGINTNKGLKNTKLTKIIFSLLGIIVLSIGIYYSIFLSKKIFLDDFNRMNEYYKQTLFNSGLEKREETLSNYNKLVEEYSKFENKYKTYKPYSIKSDTEFNKDLIEVEGIIRGVKDNIYNGNLKAAHTDLESVRVIYQEMFKRNGFSMLSISLVDFHDSMEKVLDAANDKNAEGVILAYSDASLKLGEVEKNINDEEVARIRKNLDDILNLAKNNKIEELPSMASELKSSFVKVYLKRG